MVDFLTVISKSVILCLNSIYLNDNFYERYLDYNLLIRV